MLRSICFAWVFFMSTAHGVEWGNAQDSLGRIRIQAGPQGRQSGMIECILPEALSPAEFYGLIRGEDGKAVPTQLSSKSPKRLFWCLEKPLAANAFRDYEVIEKSKASPEKMTCQNRGGKLVIASGDNPILTYHHKVLTPPEGIPSLYQRSGFIHPLVTPGGRVVTDDFPPDHAHQHGVFRAWVNTKYLGKKVDFWNQHRNTGDVKHLKIEQIRSGPVFAEFSVELEHQQTLPGSPPLTILREQWHVRAHRCDNTYLVDIVSEQQAATANPLEILEYHYGGFAFRGHRDWNADSDFEFQTSGRDGRLSGNHTRPNWVLMTGPVEGAFASCLAMGHPSNFRHPQPVRLHPKMPYFCFAPMVLGDFAITPESSLKGQIRLVLSDGKMQPETAKTHWVNYSQPIQATFYSSQ